MKTKKIITLLVFALFVGIISSYAQCTLTLNGRSANANLFNVTGDSNTITITPADPCCYLSYIRIDYYIGSNYYSEVITQGVPFYLNGITSFTISSSYSTVYRDPDTGFDIYQAYETEMYIVSC